MAISPFEDVAILAELSPDAGFGQAGWLAKTVRAKPGATRLSAFRLEPAAAVMALRKDLEAKLGRGVLIVLQGGE